MASSSDAVARCHQCASSLHHEAGLERHPRLENLGLWRFIHLYVALFQHQNKRLHINCRYKAIAEPFYALALYSPSISRSRRGMVGLLLTWNDSCCTRFHERSR